MQRLLLVLVVALAACGGVTPTPGPSVSSTTSVRTGSVVFGMALSEADVKITAPAETFSRAFPGIVYFVASFNEAPGVPSLTITVTRESATGRDQVSTGSAAIADPGGLALAGGKTLPELGALQPGSYVLRVLRDTTILAEGHFEVN